MMPLCNYDRLTVFSWLRSGMNRNPYQISSIEYIYSISSINNAVGTNVTFLLNLSHRDILRRNTNNFEHQINIILKKLQNALDFCSQNYSINVISVYPPVSTNMLGTRILH